MGGQMIIRQCQREHKALSKLRSAELDKPIMTRFQVDSSPAMGVIKNGEEQAVQFAQVKDLWFACQLNDWGDYRDVIEEELFTRFTDSKGGRNTRKIIRLLGELNSELTANNRNVQNFIREWTKLFFEETIYYRIGWTMSDFGNLGSMPCDDYACWGVGGLYESHPVALYHQLSSFVIYLSYNPRLHNEYDFIPYVQARCWGWIDTEQADLFSNGYVYLTNSYYKYIPQNQRFFVRAVETQQGSGILEFGKALANIGLYKNKDLVCVHPLGMKTVNYRESEPECRCMVCNKTDYWICEDCQNTNNGDYVRCESCNCRMHIDNSYSCDCSDYSYCRSCFDATFTPCAKCEEYCWAEGDWFGPDSDLCKNCFDRLYDDCSDCSVDGLTEGYCADCLPAEAVACKSCGLSKDDDNDVEIVEGLEVCSQCVHEHDMSGGDT